MKKMGLCLSLVVIPMLAAALTVGMRASWDQSHFGRPILEYPETIDLGEQERGQPRWVVLL